MNPRAGWTSGTIDAETENLAAFWVVYQDREKPVLVSETYAVLIVWRGNERRFYLYDNEEKSFFKTADFDEFLNAFDKLPKGIAVQRFDQCCAPFAYDMPETQYRRLGACLERRGRRWAVNQATGLSRHIICTCEKKRLRFP